MASIMVFLIKILVHFIKNLIALGKFGMLDEYASYLQDFADSLEGSTAAADKE